MKIICTVDEKEWVFPLLLNSDRCPKSMVCNGRTCEQCLNEEIEWVIGQENRKVSKKTANTRNIGGVSSC